jgi:predicted DNA-binding transcriptional regulator AlpA
LDITPTDLTKLLTIEQYCAQADISKATLYLRMSRGKGPKTVKRGGRRYVVAEEAAE